jgi:hypothetical protein
VNEGPRLDLLRPRDLGGLFRDAFRSYIRYFPAFVAIGAAVVVPVELVVSGVGLGQLGGDYSDATSTGASAVTLAESYLLIGPLVTAMVIHALLAVADGRRPRPGPAIISGLEAFRPIFVAVLIGAAGVVLGFIALILPGIWLAVRWYFTAQAVVVDGRRGVAALERSAELVSGSWWRVAGIIVFVAVVTEVASAVVVVPLTAVARGSDSGAVFLLGQVLGSVLTTPFAALMLTLLYFDLLARHRLPAMVPPVPPPPDDGQRP